MGLFGELVTLLLHTTTTFSRPSKTSMDDKSKKMKKLLALDDCDRPACDDVQSMFQKAAAAAEASRTSSTSSSTVVVEKKATMKSACPAGSAELGRSTWTLLHSMVAWYPDTPSLDDQRHMSAFMTSLARFYPCTWCATDFQHHVQESPPAATSRTELCQWMCHQHNTVNAKLGKPAFSCDMKALDDRWRKSDRPECRDSFLYHARHDDDDASGSDPPQH